VRKLKSALLAAGNGYSLDAIKEERERIDARLKENGFYYFNLTISKYKLTVL
jgi:hypothetical protein